MSDEPSPDLEGLTRAIQAWTGGDPAAEHDVFLRLQQELRRIARAQLGAEANRHTLQPTALVHEAWVKLFHTGNPGVEGRSHLVGLMAKAMRSVLVDHARAKAAQKRGSSARPLSLDATGVVRSDDSGLTLEPADLLVVDETIERLRAVDAELAQVVELRFWAGLTNEDIASALRVHPHTVERRFQLARAWMQRELDRAATRSRDDGPCA